MKKYLVFGVLILGGIIKSDAQVQQTKNVISFGGGIAKNGTYTSHSVIGEMVVGQFSTGSYSGSIGFLDTDDSLALGLNFLEKSNQQILIYPNPASGDIWVNLLPINSSPLTVTVTNSIGICLFYMEYIGLEPRPILLDKSIFPVSGIYIVSVASEVGIVTNKLVVTH